MKHSLGKCFLLCIHILWLHAGDFDYNISVDNPNPYMKEATLVTIEVRQTNHDIVLLFDFDLLKDENYTFQRVDIEEIDAYHAAQIRYTYLVYPLASGEVPIHFTLTQKATTDESVAYSFSGDRDNVKGLVTSDTTVDLSPLILNVKPLPLGTELVGDFSLDFHVKKYTALAFEPIPLQLSIKGKGYPPLLDNTLLKEGNFTRFIEEPLVHSVASLQGTKNTITYAMALSSEKSFTLSPLRIKAFNPANEKSYILTMPEQKFDIHKADAALLIDTIDTPPPFVTDWSWVETFLSYLLVFSAGYLSAWSWKWNKKKQAKEDPLKKKIQEATTPKKLLQILLSQDAKYFVSPIEKLERILYENEKISLHEIKQEALDKKDSKG